jgi:hypothetical protein
MVYDIQDYWVFGLCPSSRILKTQKNTTFQELDLFPSSGEGTGATYSVGPLILSYFLLYACLSQKILLYFIVTSH